MARESSSQRSRVGHVAVNWSSASMRRTSTSRYVSAVPAPAVSLSAVAGDASSGAAGRSRLEIRFFLLTQGLRPGLLTAAPPGLGTTVTVVIERSLHECLECNFENDVEGMLTFFSAESEFYPCLDSTLRKGVIEKFERSSE